MMTSSIPSGDGTVTDGPTRSALDNEAAPGTGLEPDTAADAAGDGAPAGVDVNRSESEPSDEQAADPPESTEATPAGGESAATGDRTVLDGPALENKEMHIATDDLRSSEEKSAAARAIADELTAKTQPTAG